MPVILLHVHGCNVTHNKAANHDGSIYFFHPLSFLKLNFTFCACMYIPFVSILSVCMKTNLGLCAFHLCSLKIHLDFVPSVYAVREPVMLRTSSPNFAYSCLYEHSHVKFTCMIRVLQFCPGIQACLF